ncbi:MAG: DUF4214 domain-containing protein [Syntrophobacterales bacterium]|nr:DUF4214 domain-containing protein [Syntrophobacterales bacterium]
MKTRVFLIVIIFLLGFVSFGLAGDILLSSGSQRTRISWVYEFSDEASRIELERPKLSSAASASGARLFVKREPSLDSSDRLRVTVKGEGTISELRRFLMAPTSNGVRILLSRPTTLIFEGRAPKRKEVNVLLRANITTGYSWSVADETLSSFEDYEAFPYVQKEPRLGGEGESRFVFRTSTFGLKRIVLRYHRPWEEFGNNGAMVTVKSSGEIPEMIPLVLDSPSTEKPSLSLGDEGGSFVKEEATGTTPPLGQSLPSSYDLRPRLTAVKDQGECGSCWAFATVGVLEGLIKMRSGAATDLSEQFLVSCNRDGWSCDGGWFAHDYHKDKVAREQSQAGAVVEQDMPYTATNGACFAIPSHPYSISNWGYANAASSMPSVNDIKQALYNYGPLAAAVCVGRAFQSYRGGIFETDESSVCQGSVNHAIVLVGWDDSQGVWILRNSWGSGWGENGYMRIKWGVSKVGYKANYAEFRGSCTYSVSPQSLSIDSEGGTATISISTSSGSCSWSSGSNASWIRITSTPNGIGNGQVQISIERNGGSARSGSLTVAGQTVTVNQAGTSACSYSVTPTSLSLPPSSSEGTITVTTQSGCNWSASSPEGWIQIVSGATGSGSGTVRYRASQNTGPPRSTTLLVAGERISVNQGASTSCTYSLNSLSNTFSASGGTGTISVLTGSGCSWRASSGASWVNIVSGISGTGSGTVTYRVDSYSGTSMRTATITIADQSFLVRQTGVSPGGNVELQNGVSRSDSVSGNSEGSAWNYYFVTIPPGTTRLTVTLRNLTGDVDLFMLRNERPTSNLFDCVSGGEEQTEEECSFLNPLPGVWWIGVSNWDVGNISYTIRAMWTSGCVVDVTPETLRFPAYGGEGIIYVGAMSGCNWRATSSVDWITVTSGSGTGSGMIRFLVGQFTGSGYREGSIEVGGMRVPIRQSSATRVTNVLKNPGFEEGSSYWEELSLYDFPIIYHLSKIEGLPPIEGSYVAWLGGYDDEIALLRQRVFIPSGSDASLRFYLWINSEDECGYDLGGVWVLDRTGRSILKRIAASDLCWLTDTGRWIQSPFFDLSEFSGREVVVEFFTLTDDSFPSSLFVDRVELNVWDSGEGGEVDSRYLREVQKAYVAYYGRPADPGGQDYWARRLQEAGGDLRAIIEAFGTSQEFISRYGGMTNSQLIDTIYQQMFGRNPDPEGKAFYLDRLNRRLMTLQTITLDVMNGAQGDDLTVINNRIEVAEYFTRKLRENPSCRYATLEDIRRAQAILQAVTKEASSVTVAKARVELFCQ